MEPAPRSWTDLRWIEPQSRWVLRTFFKRDLAVMTDSARRTTNWTFLILDALLLYVLLRLS